MKGDPLFLGDDEEVTALREDRDRLIAELAKEREQARAAREQTISYAEQKTADWKGIADVLKVKLDDSALRCVWLERELKLEKAKNSRKNRI